jgi:hypothetical protein
MPIIVEHNRRPYWPRWASAALYLLGIGTVITCMIALPSGGLLREATLLNWQAPAGTETTLAKLPGTPVVRISHQHVSLIDEPERHLLIRTSDGTIRTRLMSGWGPRMRASVYAVGNDQLAVLDAGGGSAFV